MMSESESFFENILQRDRAIVTAALVVLVLTAWFYVLWLTGYMFPSAAGSMAGMDMPGMNMRPLSKPWGATELAVSFAMWSVMMVGMMTPSATPMILIYTRVARQGAAQGTPFASSAWFAAGYLLAWCGFALLASLAQALLVSTALVTPSLAATSNVFGAAVLIIAGLYQWSALKHQCLSQCRAPLAFIQHNGGFRRDAGGALKLGLKHGLYCIGCCWALMALLFVFGVMNLLWIAALSILVLMEKVVFPSWVMSQGVGLVLVGWGIIFAFRTLM